MFRISNLKWIKIHREFESHTFYNFNRLLIYMLKILFSVILFVIEFLLPKIKIVEALIFTTFNQSFTKFNTLPLTLILAETRYKIGINTNLVC